MHKYLHLLSDDRHARPGSLYQLTRGTD
jgi:hypothetical protein